jgi:hypothetical protein
MQRGQIGVPQRPQRSRVRVLGCRAQRVSAGATVVEDIVTLSLPA